MNEYKAQAEIRGSKFHSVDMVQDPSGVNLEVALFFRRLYAQAICDVLENRFVDNDLIDCSKILSLTNLPQRQVGLSSYRVVQLDCF